MTNITYLISRYPAISHTFILREVLHLKSMGIKINVASINSPDRDNDKLTHEEVGEKNHTFYVKQQGAMGAAKSIFAQLISQPLVIFKTLFTALKLNSLDMKNTLYNVFYLVEAVMISQWMKQNNSQHIHVHFASEAATVGLLVKQLTGCSYSVYVHGPDEFYNVNRYALSTKIEHADFIFCISDFAKSQLMKLSDYKHWDKFIVRRLGVDTEKFAPVKRSDTDTVTILSVGRLCPAKGQHILLLAGEKLRKNNISFHMVLVGNGPDRNSLEALASTLGLTDYVTFTGAVNHDEVHAYYQQADIFCLPSFAEGIPIVLMEAMAQEIPVVTTHITGIPELINDDINGILTTPSNVEELASRLEKLITDNDYRRQLATAGRTRILEQYNLSDNTTLFAEKFIEMLERKVD